MNRTAMFLTAVLILSMGSFFCSKQKVASSTRDSAGTLVPPTTTRTDSGIVNTRTIGPVTIGRDHMMNVYIHITRVHLKTTESWPDSDTSFVVVDSLGRELYRRRSVNEPGGAQTDFDCLQFTISTVGSTLVCCSSISPSYGDDGGDTQVLGLDSNGKLVPFTSVMPQGASNVVFLDSRNTVEPTFVDSTKPYAQPALETDYSIGSFRVKGYFHIYPNGFTDREQPHTFDFDKWPVLIDAGEAQKGRKRANRTDSTVLLFDKPNKEKSGTNRVLVRLDSQIKFLDAAYVGNWWLHVIIDGHEGYINKSQFVVLGLPDAD